jgi:SAM-dependent methyltransferase
MRSWSTQRAPFVEPFSKEYVDRHRTLVSEALATKALIHRFARGRRLPRPYGVGMDERVVEYPWTFAQRPGGKVLDAGSALNHAHILDEFLPTFEDLHVVTLAPETLSFTERRISYVYSDLRDLPFRDAYYDTIISISTLEHVGMNTARYGAAPSTRGNPRDELRAAVRELKRVLSPGGLLLITVPYGIAGDHGWFRQFDHDGVQELIDAIAPRELSIAVYAYSSEGWQVSSLAGSAGAKYQDPPPNADIASDLAAAARAVVCVRALP